MKTEIEKVSLTQVRAIHDVIKKNREDLTKLFLSDSLTKEEMIHLRELQDTLMRGTTDTRNEWLGDKQ